jgi:hypothetical protein
MSKEEDCCKGKSNCWPVTGGCGDVVTRALGKVGISTSMLITLALIPWAWEGVVWVADAVRSIWNMVSGVGV